LKLIYIQAQEDRNIKMEEWKKGINIILRCAALRTHELEKEKTEPPRMLAILHDSHPFEMSLCTV
jgi:hypothetical protein